jgi:hypothetical protein
MKNVVECKKEFFAYFNALEIYSEIFLWLITTIMVWNDDEMVRVAASLSQPRPPNQG